MCVCVYIFVLHLFNFLISPVHRSFMMTSHYSIKQCDDGILLYMGLSMALCMHVHVMDIVPLCVLVHDLTSYVIVTCKDFFCPSVSNHNLQALMISRFDSESVWLATGR